MHDGGKSGNMEGKSRFGGITNIERKKQMPQSLIESAGFGGIGGLLLGFLTAFGLRDRIKRVEREKQDKSFCISHTQKIDMIYEDVRYLRQRIDLLSNGRNSDRDEIW